MTDTYGPAMTEFSEYPGGTNTCWPLPSEVDANGYICRTNLFNAVEEKRAFKSKYGYELTAPKTYGEMRDLAEFFTRPPNLYGIATSFSKEYDGIPTGYVVIWRILWR